jgi:hypothetical protein
MNSAIELKTSYFKSLIQTAAARASWKQVVGFVFENRRTNGASNPVTQGFFLATSAKPFINYPERKDRRKENKKVDKDQYRQFYPNHGGVPPQWNVTDPQFRLGSGLNLTERMKFCAA